MNILHLFPGPQRFLLRERYRFSPGSGHKESILSFFVLLMRRSAWRQHFSRCGEKAVWARKGLWLARQPRPVIEVLMAAHDLPDVTVRPQPESDSSRSRNAEADPAASHQKGWSAPVSAAWRRTERRAGR